MADEFDVDMNGTKLKIGDKVVYCYNEKGVGNKLRYGVVERIDTLNKVKGWTLSNSLPAPLIRPGGGGRLTHKWPEEILKLSDKESV